MVRPVAVALLGAFVSIFVASAASAAGPLFPQALHLTRQVHDPLSATTTVLEEYAQGNRLVSVRGAKTSIADYDKGELMEIDREAGTYSITRFDAIARAQHILGNDNVPAAGARASERSLHSAGMRASKLGRNAEVFETELDGDVKAKLEIAVDRTALVSKNALEVLLGAAYPGVHRPEHDAVMAAAASTQRGGGRNVSSNSADEPLYALPVEQTIRYQIEGQTLELRTSVVRLGNETPPADLLAIPAGARLVPSRLVAVSDELERLDRTAPAAPPSTQRP